MASFLGGAPATDSLDLEVAAASSRTAGRSSLKARGSPSAAAMSRIIMERQSQSRRRVKAKILQQRAAAVKTAQRTKLAKERQWKKRMATSPFAVDLVAETERIDEENRVRLRQERRRARQAEQRKQSLKNTIIRKALTEETDLDTLRMEKRAIIDEERRLKALLDLEKASAKRKQDLLAAQRAERQRKEAKSEFLRRKRMERLARVQQEEREMLSELLDVPEPADYGLRIGAGVVGELGGTG